MKTTADKKTATIVLIYATVPLQTYVGI